jgi:transposase
VDTLGHFLALHVTPASADDRAEAGRIAKDIQAATGERAATAAAEHGIQLEVVKLPDAKRGFMLLPKRWVVERSFAWATRFRRLVKDDERCAQTLADLHLIAFVCLMLKSAAKLAVSS